MRGFKFICVLAICVLALGVMVSAAPKPFGVADSRNVVFENPVRVGDVLLPRGEYKVLHTMNGDEHIMVFQQQKTKNPTETKVKCSLVPLTAKAPRTERVFVVNATNERVLRELTFEGDTAKHVF
jgi:hypothetical protein